MPWKINKRGGEYCVVKYDGSTVKCHPTRPEALAHMRALYASEGKEMSKGILSIPDELATKIKSFIGMEVPDPDSDPDPVNSFTLFKSESGEWRWAAIWSNKYRDDDNPPEILSEKAHLDFVNAVEVEKSYPYQELQLWHYPPITWGDTRHLAYDTDNGLHIACGDVRKGYEPVAEVIASLPPDTVGVSHGMPIAEIQRDPNDPSVIVRYRSKEISVLPKYAAANKLTGYFLGGTMQLNPKGTSQDIEKWLGKERFDEIAQVADLMGKEAKDKELEYKDNTPIPEVPLDSPLETPPAETKESEPINLDAFRQEIVKEVYQPLADAVLAIKDALVKLSEGQKSLTETVNKLSASDEQKVAEQVKETPRLSLAGIIAQSVIGDESIRVDGRTVTARDKPKETVSESPPLVDGLGLFGGILTDIINGKALGE